MSIDEIIISLLVASGALIMLLAAVSTRRVLELIKGAKHYSNWRILLILMEFFFVGYLMVLTFIMAGETDMLVFLSGMIFFFGAVFVYLVVRTGYITINDLISTTVSKEYSENIMRSMGESLIVVSPEETIKIVNKATCELLDYEEDELIDKPIKTILLESKRETVTSQTFAELFEKKEFNNIEMTYLSKDGLNIPVLFSGSILNDEQDVTQGYICVAQNITERKRAEAELTVKITELERFNKLAVDRELKMIMLKENINELLVMQGREREYDIPI